MSLNDYTDTFEYTHALVDLDSEVIESLYYDEDSQELVVVIKGANLAYLYFDVTKDEAGDFFNSSSKGYHYNTYVKRVKTSDHLGDAEDYYFVKAEQKFSANVGFDGVGYTSLRTVPPVENTEGFTPKALVDKTEYTPLRAVPAESGKRTFQVRFFLGDNPTLKMLTVDAESLIEAAEAAVEIGEIMEVSVDLVGVSVTE